MTSGQAYWKLNNHCVGIEDANQIPSDEIYGLLEWYEIAMTNKTPADFPTEKALNDWTKRVENYLTTHG